MVAATAPDQAVLRGKAMECAGLVGEAVGVEVFARDAMEIMQLFIHAIVSPCFALHFVENIYLDDCCGLFISYSNKTRSETSPLNIFFPRVLASPRH